MKQENMTAIVTGGGRGIGKAISIALAKQGVSISVAARTEEEINETKRMIESMGGKAIAIRADVTKEEDIKKLVAKTIKRFGKIDILVNNAGVAIKKPVTEMSLHDYDEIMDTNLKGMFLCTKYALPHMIKNSSGTIINISSGAGKHGAHGLSVYSASKFAVIGFTESLALEVGNKIRVHAVCPGGVDTKMYRSLFDSVPPFEPRDVANKVIELCMPDVIVQESPIDICV